MIPGTRTYEHRYAGRQVLVIVDDGSRAVKIICDGTSVELGPQGARFVLTVLSADVLAFGPDAQ